MLNLAEYRRRDKHLADYLPWASLVAPGILLNKDGSFQRTLRYRGPDLDSATEAELVAVTARLNNALKRLGEGWALFFEAERVAAHGYPPGRFADAALIVLAAGALVLFPSGTALGAGSGMPWEAPLQRILESIEGPVAKVVAVVTIIMTGLSLAFGDMGGGLRRLVQIVFGLSIAFAGGAQIN